MISKEKLLELLKRCLDSEEKAIPIYAKHINNTFFLSEFNKGDQAKLKDVLETLKRESTDHMKIYKDLLQKIKESPQDVY